MEGKGCLDGENLLEGDVAGLEGLVHEDLKHAPRLRKDRTIL